MRWSGCWSKSWKLGWPIVGGSDGGGVGLKVRLFVGNISNNEIYVDLRLELVKSVSVSIHIL